MAEGEVKADERETTKAKLFFFFLGEGDTTRPGLGITGGAGAELWTREGCCSHIWTPQEQERYCSWDPHISHPVLKSALSKV